MFAIARVKENSRSGDYLELSSDEGSLEMHPKADMIPWISGAFLERRPIDNKSSWAASICWQRISIQISFSGQPNVMEDTLAGDSSATGEFGVSLKESTGGDISYFESG